jgi:hypothetical protein
MPAASTSSVALICPAGVDRVEFHVAVRISLHALRSAFGSIRVEQTALVSW